MNTLSGERILEVKKMYRKAHSELLETHFDMDGEAQTRTIDIPAKTFFTDYYTKHKLSINFLYAVREKRFAARVLLSNNYLKSLNLRQQVDARYVQCLCIPQFQPKKQDYVRLNRFFHSFAWKTPLEQQMLIACKLGNTIYEEFLAIVKGIRVMDSNANVFKNELLTAIHHLDVMNMVTLSSKLHMLNRWVDIYSLQTLVLIGFYLWVCVDFKFPVSCFPLIDKFTSNQNIIYPHGVLRLETMQSVQSTLQAVFEANKAK